MNKCGFESSSRTGSSIVGLSTAHSRTAILESKRRLERVAVMQMINKTQIDAQRYSRLAQDAEQRKVTKHNRSTSKVESRPASQIAKPKQTLARPALHNYTSLDLHNDFVNLELMSPSFHAKTRPKCAQNTFTR
jgi:hypothetical protein